jgi:hypothetical protein
MEGGDGARHVELGLGVASPSLLENVVAVVRYKIAGKNSPSMEMGRDGRSGGSIESRVETRDRVAVH